MSDLSPRSGITSMDEILRQGSHSDLFLSSYMIPLERPRSPNSIVDAIETMLHCSSNAYMAVSKK